MSTAPIAMKVLVVPTVPHTGTSFIRAMVQNIVKDLNIVDFVQIRKSASGWRNSWTGEAGLTRGKNLVIGHITERELPIIEALASQWGAVTPLRDPLLTMISRKVRGHDPATVLKQWSLLADSVLFQDAAFLALRAGMSRQDKEDFMLKFLGDLGGIDESTFDAWASNWPIVNSKGYLELHAHYDARDRSLLNEAFRAQANELRALAPRLHEMFNEAGFETPFWWERQ